MSRPQRFLNRMLLFLLAVIAICSAIWRPLLDAFMGNPALNGIILGVMLVGIVYSFRQVVGLNPEVDWILNYRRDHSSISSGAVPRLLSPLATMLGERGGSRVSLSALALRSLLDGIATRLDESRELTRYFIGLLVFLGLLGTFYGLLETLRSVGGVIDGLQIGGGDVGQAFQQLKSGLSAPLSGMGTAFSASLFGLAASLVLGFLDLQAGQAQNRFYNDLEEWLSGFTRLSGGAIGDGTEGSVPAYVQALLEQTADSLDKLQRVLAAKHQDEESARHHLRNIEAYLARMADDATQGREQMVQELRDEIRLVARTIAAIAEEAER